MKELEINTIDYSEELWRDVVGYEQFYEISTEGRLRTKPRVCTIGWHKGITRMVRYFKLTPHPGGYIQIGLKDINSHTKRTGVHRLVATAFIPNPDNKPMVNHKNGIKTDNHVKNLEWVTRIENARHSFDTGLQVNPKGQDHSCAKLTEQDVLDIRSKYQPCGVYSALTLSKEYNISLTQIKDIINRKSWTHI